MTMTIDQADQTPRGRGRLRVVHDEPTVDLEAAENAVADLLVALGHLCMSLRGVRASGSRTVTSSVQGLLREDVRSRQEFFALTGAIR